MSRASLGVAPCLLPLLLLLLAVTGEAATGPSSSPTWDPPDGQLLTGDDAPTTGSGRASTVTASIERTLTVEPWDRLEELGDVTDATDGSLERTFMRPAALRANAMVEAWMRDAGMRTWVDEVGNVHGRVDGVDKTAKTLLIGSHIDTVRDAGKYDGGLGIIVGIAAVKAMTLEANASASFAATRDASGNDARGERPLLLTRPVEVVAFSDEEGVRFSSTFLGSRALVGAIPENVYAARDADGETFLGALRAAGFEGTREAVAKAKVRPGSIDHYVEVHIEQGPVLQTLRRPVAAVAGIAGQTRLTIAVFGVQGHAGTVPMAGRKDAVAAAAEMISYVERRCTTHRSDQSPGESFREGDKENEEKDDTALVCTVGDVRVWPGSSNSIAGAVNFTVDVRSKLDAERDEACSRRMMRCEVSRNHDANAVMSSEEVTSLLRRATAEVYEEVIEGTAGTAANAVHPDDRAELLSRPPPILTSGAGHDALAMSEACPVGMLFVRCRDGVSHSPLERAEPPDVAFAARVLWKYLQSAQGWKPRSSTDNGHGRDKNEL